MIEHAYVAFGCNLDEVSPRDVTERLKKRGINVLRVAHCYESAPAEGVQGGNFLNTVFECERTESPESFLQIMQEVEREFGSATEKHMGERSCDLDMLLWGDEIIDLPWLRVPHPRMQQRDFVLAPLSDLVPDARLPLLEQTPRDLFSLLKDRYIIRKISE